MNSSMASESKVLKVAMVSAFFPAHGGGIEVVAGHLAINLVQRETLSMTWIADGADEVDDSSFPRVQILRAKSWDPFEKRIGLPFPCWSPRSLLILWDTVKKSDVVHVHDYLYVPSLAALIFAKILGVPVLLTQHIGQIRFGSKIASGVLEALNRTLGALSLRVASQAAFVARPVFSYFDRFVTWKTPAKVIPNGVDRRRYKPSESRQIASNVRLLFVGRFVEKKGIKHFERCFDLPNSTWTFVGGGALNPRQLWGTFATVRVLEGLRGDDVIPYYQEADLLVLPSTGEGFPLVVQEALACGTPVLVSAEVAEAFPVLDERCVFSAELRVDDPGAALRNAVEELLNAPERLAQARVHATSLASQWSWEQCAESYRQIYESLADAKSRRLPG